MIDYLKGQIAHIEDTYVIIDVNGIGYRVFCANPYDFQPLDEHVQTMFIHYHVREDAVLLYGFRTRDEQHLFRKLIEVSGIGPRVASGIMSGAQPEAIISAIQSEDIAFLTTLPGIGRKTAQRILIDLKDKLDGMLAHLPAVSDDADRATHQVGQQSVDKQWIEAKAALAALGYNETELNQCWPSIRGEVKETDGTDHIIKLALQALFKG